MDERDRNRYREAHNRTALDRLDFIDTELRTAATFAEVAVSHYDDGEHLEARQARGQAAIALDQAIEAMQAARDHGQSTGHFDERMGQLRSSLNELYDRDPPRAE